MLFAVQAFKENVELLAEAEILLDGVEVVSDGVTVHEGVSTAWRKYTGEHVDSCCFTGTVVAENGEDFTFTDGEI
jgi:hypothetical protein